MTDPIAPSTVRGEPEGELELTAEAAAAGDDPTLATDTNAGDPDQGVITVQDEWSDLGVPPQPSVTGDSPREPLRGEVGGG